LANIFLQDNIGDICSYNNVRGGSYLVKEAYTLLRSKEIAGGDIVQNFEIVWNKFIPLKVSLDCGINLFR